MVKALSNLMWLTYDKFHSIANRKTGRCLNHLVFEKYRSLEK